MARRHERPRGNIATPLQWRQCESKRRYPDRGNALKAGRGVLAFDAEPPLWIYKCKFCKGYHLTKRPGREHDRVLTG